MEPARLLCLWDFSGKNTGVDCHFLLQGIFPGPGMESTSALAGELFTTEPPRKPTFTPVCSVAQSCLILFDPLDCSPPGSSVGFPRQEYWNELPFPSLWDLPDLGIEYRSPALAGGFFTTEPPERY